VIRWMMVIAVVSIFSLPLAAEVKGASPQQFKQLLQQAAAGDAYAQLNVGAAYDNGLGVDRDIDKALFWYQKAAEKGVAEAQFNLAHLLVTQELSATTAAEWMRKAADQGMVDAEYLMGVIYAEGLGVEMDKAEARRWLKKAIAKGHDEAAQFLREMDQPPG